MNGPSAAQNYRPTHFQPQNGGYINNQRQAPARNEPPRAFTAAHTANVFGGQAVLQPIPSVEFRPKTYASLTGTVNILPGVLSADASKTVRFDPSIRVSPTDTGGVTVGFTPRVELELNGQVRVGLDNILNVGLGLNGGVGGSKKFTFSAPEFTANLEPNGTFRANANFNPTFGSEQKLTVDGGVGFGVGGFGVGANQSVSHSLEQQIRVGGPGVQFEMMPTGRPTISTNFDRTVSISNSYTFAPKTNFNAQFNAGQFGANAQAGVEPSFTVEHTVTFNTDPSRKMAPRHEFHARSGVSVDGSFGFRVSALPSGSPLNLSAEVGFNPSVSVSGGGRYRA